MQQFIFIVLLMLLHPVHLLRFFSFNKLVTYLQFSFHFLKIYLSLFFIFCYLFFYSQGNYFMCQLNNIIFFVVFFFFHLIYLFFILKIKEFLECVRIFIYNFFDFLFFCCMECSILNFNFLLYTFRDYKIIK